MGKLSDNERKVITERIRGLRLEHMHAGISTQSMVICDNCREAKPLVGAARYRPYRLCNDCALGYELAKAAGDIKSIEDFILAEARDPEKLKEEGIESSIQLREIFTQTSRGGKGEGGRNEPR